MKMPSLRLEFGRTLLLLVALVGLVVGARAQTLYVSVNGGGTIQQVTAGSAVTYASGLLAPKGIAFAPNGDFYVSQDINGSLTSVISKVTSGGSVTTFASGFQYPMGLAVNSDGDLFVADRILGEIFKVSGGVVTTYASGLSEVFGLAFNSSGTLYAATRGSTNSDTGAIWRVDGVENKTQIIAGLNQPNDLAIDSAGNLYVTNFGTSSISKISADGTSSVLFADGGDGLISPVGLAFDPVSGNLFVASQGNDSIYEITPGGVASVFASGISSAPQYLAFAPSAIPEPGVAAGLAGAAAIALAFWRRRRGGGR